MKSKEKGWVSDLLGWGEKRQSETHERLYAAAIEIARRPVLFTDHGVRDDVDGRFDALSLVVALVMRRLKGLDEEGRELSQQMFDSMFADMDLSLREMGAGDLGVSKRVRVMAEAFMGRLDAYATAIDADDRDASRRRWNEICFVARIVQMLLPVDLWITFLALLRLWTRSHPKSCWRAFDASCRLTLRHKA